eukprot:28530-Eustigmatos_ZCMA.PRE.1
MQKLLSGREYMCIDKSHDINSQSCRSPEEATSDQTLKPSLWRGGRNNMRRPSCGKAGCGLAYMIRIDG